MKTRKQIEKSLKIPKRNIYWYNMYSPNKVLRRWISRMICRIADRYYGVEVMNQVGIGLKERKMIQKKWFYWMNVKNKIFWTRTFLDRIADKIIKG